MTRQPSQSTLHTRHFACKLASPHFQVFFFPTFVSFPIFSLYIELLYLSFFFIHSNQRERERKREKVTPMAKPVALLPLLLLILSTHLAFSYRSEQGSPRRESRYNPYHFSEDSFQTVLSSREGKLRVLERFSEQSDLLRGIDNYRVALFQANPNTALIPTHCDCDSILFVAAGSS